MARVLVIGGGGREHALARALADDRAVDHVFCAPGNGGTSVMERVTNVPLKEKQDLLAFADRESIDLTVVGPEVPLVEGFVDYFRAHDQRIFGFRKSAARLEGSKAFAKRFMQRYSIPTAPFQVFENHYAANRYLVEQYAESPNRRFYIKADELCAGKGAIAARSLEEAQAAIKRLLVERACGAGERVVIEDAIQGQEASVIVLTDGHSVATLPAAQDHKQVFDGDEGPNTGGMGTYAPAQLVSEAVYERIEREIVLPTLMGMEDEGISDCGVIFFGLMLDSKGKPYLLEYNLRFGDPEAQPLLTLMSSDLYPTLIACTEGKLDEQQIEWHDGASVCVVMSVAGYPDRYDHQDEEIRGIGEAESLGGVTIYHAGTDERGGRFYTKGGRILGVTSLAPDLASARDRAYEAVDKISFEGMHFRRDIAARALR